MTSFYITTPIYYVNDVPHLGHAYTSIAADALARFHRARGNGARLLTGTDEHGQKIVEAARERGTTPQGLADTVVDRFRATWSQLEIGYDDFIRTTEDRHARVVADMWKRIADSGDIYLGRYDGWYCVSCEAFYPESQLEDGTLCPTHRREAQWVSEPSYYFKMSRYQDALLRHFEDHPTFVQPEGYKNEVVSFIKGGLRDLSVSRTSFDWGIPVPDDPAHVVYVWIDALTNYISALGDIGGDRYREFWPATCHLIGKDILRFHAVYWPCMLLSAGLPLPQTIYTHGWWTVRGEKISKSMPATRVDPNLLASDISADALRYFLLREVPLGGDGDFSYEALIQRYNADLANDLGNLLNRTLTMTVKFLGGRAPAAHADLADREPHAGLAVVATNAVREAAAAFEAYQPSRALEAIWRLVRETNRYVDTAQPWKLAKDPERRQELEHAAHTFLEAVSWCARMVAPVMPTKAADILAQLGFSDPAAAAARWPDPARLGDDLPADLAIDKPRPLFPRIDDAREAELLERWVPADARPAAETAADEAPEPARVSFDEFSRLDLRVGEIAAAKPVPKTSKLLALTVRVGEDDTRSVVAGLAARYAPEELVGRRVIVVANLEPATIRGVRSEGMVLAAGDGDILGLPAASDDVPVGTRIR